MSRCGTDPEHLNRASPHLFDLSIGGRVHPVGGDDLRRYPAGAHRFKHIWEVMADEVVRHAAFDGECIVEALVPLNKLLNGDCRAFGQPACPGRGLKLTWASGAEHAQGAGGSARLNDYRESAGVGKLACLP